MDRPVVVGQHGLDRRGRRALLPAALATATATASVPAATLALALAAAGLTGATLAALATALATVLRAASAAVTSLAATATTAAAATTALRRRAQALPGRRRLTARCRWRTPGDRIADLGFAWCRRRDLRHQRGRRGWCGGLCLGHVGVPLRRPVVRRPAATGRRPPGAAATFRRSSSIVRFGRYDAPRPPARGRSGTRRGGCCGAWSRGRR